MQVGVCVLLRIPPARRRKRSVNVREVLNGIFLSLLKNELRPIGWGQAEVRPRQSHAAGRSERRCSRRRAHSADRWSPAVVEYGR
jgi:hypothetical protein